MRHLEMPDPLAGASIQADQAFSKEAIARSLAAVVVIAGSAERQIDVAQRLVRAHHRPDIRIARCLPRILLPGLIAVLTFAGDGAEKPLLLARADIEAPQVAGRHFLYHGEVQYGGAHNHNIAANDGRRGNAVMAPIYGATQPPGQVNAPIMAEGGNGLACLRIQADQIAVACAEKDSLIVPISPVRDAPMYKTMIRRRGAFPRLRVVDPPCLSGRCVKSSDLRKRSADIQGPADHHRGRFPDPGFQMGI